MFNDGSAQSLYFPGDQTKNPDLEIFYNPNTWISSPKIKTTKTPEPVLPESNPVGYDHLQHFIQLRRETDQNQLTKSVPVKVFDVKEYLEYLTIHIVSDDDTLDNGLERCYWSSMWRALTMLQKGVSLFEGYYREGCVEEVEDYVEWFGSEIGFEAKEQFLGLLVEYFTLFLRYEKPGFLEAMPLCEALEFYLDRFPEDALRRNDEETLKSVGIGQDENPQVLVGHIGYIIDALDN